MNDRSGEAPAAQRAAAERASDTGQPSTIDVTGMRMGAAIFFINSAGMAALTVMLLMQNNGIEAVVAAATASCSVAFGLMMGRQAKRHLELARMYRGLCPKCGYSLCGLPKPRCPECGFTVSASAQ